MPLNHIEFKTHPSSLTLILDQSWVHPWEASGRMFTPRYLLELEADTSRRQPNSADRKPWMCGAEEDVKGGEVRLVPSLDVQLDRTH